MVRAGRLARLVLACAVALTLVQTASLVSRGSRGYSDVSVYYRTVSLLKTGARAEIYQQIDERSGWRIAMPPLGYALFQPFHGLGPTGSMAGWALLQLAALALTVRVLGRLVREGDPALAGAWPWAVSLLLVLASGSLQVGQFSILFVTCWVLAASRLARHAPEQAAAWLALPAALKIYPGMLFGAVASLSPSLRRAVTAAAALGLTMAALWLLVPLPFYGLATPAMNVAWWQHVVLNNAHMDYVQSLRANTNQALDTVLLRYLTYDPAFHDVYPLPHLALPKAAILLAAHAARLVVIAVSALAVLRWRRTRGAAPLGVAGILDVLALWTAALYCAMPETKTRYAVYTFLAFLPWLRALAGTTDAGQRARGTAGLLVTVVLVMVALPDALQAWGLGYLGGAWLWARGLRHLGRTPAGTTISA